MNEKDVVVALQKAQYIEEFRKEYSDSAMLFGELPDYSVSADRLFAFLVDNIDLAECVRRFIRL